MKLLTKFFILFSIILQVFCDVDDFKEINEKFKALNDELQSSTSTATEYFDNFIKNFSATFEKVPEIAPKISKFEDLVTEYKALIWPTFDDLKTCDDLKLRFSSTFLEKNKFKFLKADNDRIFKKFLNIFMGASWSWSIINNKSVINNATIKAMNHTGINLEFRKVSSIALTLSKPFKSDLQALMTDKLKTCECPSDFTSTDPSLENYRTLLEVSDSLERRMDGAFEDIGYKLNAGNRMNYQDSDGMLKFGSMNFMENFSCQRNFTKIFSSNTFKEENVPCQNLEIDLADQELKIWRSPKIVEDHKTKLIPCLESARKKVEDHLKTAKDDTKKVTEEVIEAYKHAEEVAEKLAKAVEENLEKVKEVNKAMKKVREENCACKK